MNSRVDRSHRRVVFWSAAIVAGTLLVVYFGPSLRVGRPTEAFRISGGSMAETLVGDHWRIVCVECKWKFRCDVDSPPLAGNATCPNCGCARNPVSELTLASGDEVRLAHSSIHANDISRWDVVACKDPDDPTRWLVKRVVGIPGEQVSIREGDIYIDGNVVSKPLTVFRQLAITVHDAAHAPPPSEILPNRWRAEHMQTQWAKGESQFTFRSPSDSAHIGRTLADELPIDWLVYHHWRCYPSSHARSQDVPVADNDSFSQASSRQLFEVGDLQVRFSCRNPNDQVAKQLMLDARIHDGRSRWSATMNLAIGSVSVRRDGELFTVAEVFVAKRNDVVGSWRKVEFGVLDQTIFLAVDGIEWLRRPFSAVKAKRNSVATPVAIGGSVSDWELMDLQVTRDVHYVDTWGQSDSWQPTGGNSNVEDRFFLLGDNSAHSRDSRHWQTPVRASDIVGRVIYIPDRTGSTDDWTAP